MEGSAEGRRGSAGGAAAILAAGQGAYWLVTGIWGAVNRPTFEAVTGGKQDYWLVRTVGGLLAVMGAAGISAGVSRRVERETVLTLGGGAAVLAAVDVVYALRRTVSPIYLADAVAEVGALVLWVRWRRPRRS